jgi:hypothetical protein
LPLRVRWRKISITLKTPRLTVEQTAQACDLAWFQQRIPVAHAITRGCDQYWTDGCLAPGLVCLFILLTSDYNVDRAGREKSRLGERPKICRIERNQDYMSKNFERWKELAARCLGEQDPAKLTELANEMNLILTQKTPYLDLPLHAGGCAKRANATF